MCRGVNEHEESFWITQPWAIQQDGASWLVAYILLAFQQFLDRGRPRDHIHQVTFQLLKLNLSIQSIQRGISCNTCRLVGPHHQRSENIRHQIWRNTKVFLWQMQNVWACRFIPSRSLGPLPLKGPELSLAFWRVGCLGEVQSSPAWSSFIRQHRSKI